MKKLASLLLCLAAGSSQATPAQHHTFTGFYLTGAVGATTTQFNVDPLYRADAFFDFSFLGDYPMYATSPAGLLGLGYQYQFNRLFVLGAELTAGYTKTDSSYRAGFHEVITQDPPPNLFIDITTETKATLTNDFALLIKPGLVSRKNTLFYGLIGPRWGNFETSVSPLLSLGSPPDVFIAQGTDKQSGYQLGFTIGAGIQQRLSKHFLISLEYAYTDYGDLPSPELNPPITFHGVPTSDTTKAAPTIDSSTNNLLLGLSYQW